MRLLLTISLALWLAAAQAESIRVLVQSSPLAGKPREAATIAFSIPPEYTLIANWSTLRRARWNVEGSREVLVKPDARGDQAQATGSLPAE